LTPRCAGTKKDGSQCTATVEPQQRYCWWHDPANAERRKRAASKGGRGKSNREIKSVKAWLLRLAADVESGKLESKHGAVVSQILNVFLRSAELERRIKETEELEGRLEALEGDLNGRPKARYEP
jgi:hypothetical protein